MVFFNSASDYIYREYNYTWHPSTAKWRVSREITYNASCFTNMLVCTVVMQYVQIKTVVYFHSRNPWPLDVTNVWTHRTNIWGQKKSERPWDQKFPYAFFSVSCHCLLIAKASRDTLLECVLVPPDRAGVTQSGLVLRKSFSGLQSTNFLRFRWGLCSLPSNTFTSFVFKPFRRYA